MKRRGFLKMLGLAPAVLAGTRPEDLVTSPLEPTPLREGLAAYPYVARPVNGLWATTGFTLLSTDTGTFEQVRETR